MNAADLRAEAMEQWQATPPDEHVDDEGVTHRGRTSRFRAEFVEPWAVRIGEAERSGSVDREAARQLYDACLAPIPARKALVARVERSTLKMWELRTQRRLWAEHGVMTRTRRQADGMSTGLPWVALVAGEYGIAVPAALFEVADSDLVDDDGVIDDDMADAAEVLEGEADDDDDEELGR